jgi:hypothetical protein
MQIANTILGQMGGAGRLGAMVGASMFVGGDNSLSFKFKGCTKANKCRVTLDADDTYTVDFFKLKNHGLDCTVLKSVNGIYADQLRRLFEQTTGLALSL